MKQLLFLLLFPAFALAQYQGNANQKITLGEQTTADGLVWRGIRADTTSKIVPFSDTSAYIILDTVEKTLWLYKAGQVPKWQQVGGSAGGGGTGTVTSITAGTGLTGGTITISGTLAADTSFLFTQSDTLSLNLTSRFAAKQNTLTLTTTGSSGAATLVNSTLNIPQYSGSGGVTDGDKGDIDVTNSGATWTIDTSAISLSGNKVTGTLPVANGGTGSATQNFVDLTTTQSIGGAKTFTSAVTATSFNPTSGTASGTGMFLPAANTLGFSTNGTNKMTLDSLGNLGLGVTPIAWNSIFKGIDFANKGGVYSYANYLSLSQNMYYGSGALDGWRYKATGYAADINLESNSGNIVFRNTTTSGTANAALTWNTVMTLNANGNVGIGTASPTAALHLKAGTATANTAPLKFTSGTNLTTAEAGAMEFNGTNLFFSPSTTRHTVNHGLTGSATLDFPSTTTLLSADLTITVTGAADGDIVSLGVPNAAVNANTCYTAWVSSANTVTIRFNNYSSLTVNPASGTFKVFVTK